MNKKLARNSNYIAHTKALCKSLEQWLDYHRAAGTRQACGHYGDAVGLLSHLRGELAWQQDPETAARLYPNQRPE